MPEVWDKAAVCFFVREGMEDTRGWCDTGETDQIKTPALERADDAAAQRPHAFRRTSRIASRRQPV